MDINGKKNALRYLQIQDYAIFYPNKTTKNLMIFIRITPNIHLEETIEVSDGEFCFQKADYNSIEELVARVERILKIWKEIRSLKCFVLKWDEDIHSKPLIEASDLISNDKSFKLRASTKEIGKVELVYGRRSQLVVEYAMIDGPKIFFHGSDFLRADDLEKYIIDNIHSEGYTKFLRENTVLWSSSMDWNELFGAMVPE